MRTARGILAAGLLAATAYWGLAALGLVLGAPEISLWFGLTGILTAVLAVLAFRAVMRPGPSGGDEGPSAGPDDDGGGGGPRRGGPPPGGEPPWWPEFERAFRAHAALRDREPV